MKKRIWELDALRGICILGMVLVHLVYDLVDIFGLIKLGVLGGTVYNLLIDWGGVLFLLLSGICVTLGSHPIRRGLIVLASGLLCTFVTWILYRMGFQDRSIIILFGVLHCLGICMLLWPLCKRLPTPALAVIGILLIIAGFYLQENVLVSFPWLMPLGFLYPGFVSADYFPLMPNLGFFLLGAVLGRTVYRKKQTRLPDVNTENPILKFLMLCGRMSLFIYLLHQPLITVLIELIF